MEDIDNNNNEERLIRIPANEIMKKLRTKEDRRNFCIENNWYIPTNEPGYDVTFILQVMKGQKKCLPLGFSNGFHLRSFRTGETLNKAYIINKMIGNPSYGDFIPDRIKPISLSRDFLLAIVAYVDHELYNRLYITAKNEIGKRNINKWKNYELTINTSVFDKLTNYVPIENSKPNTKSFRISKKGINTGIFMKIQRPQQINININNHPIRINQQDEDQ